MKIRTLKYFEFPMLEEKVLQIFDCGRIYNIGEKSALEIVKNGLAVLVDPEPPEDDEDEEKVNLNKSGGLESSKENKMVDVVYKKQRGRPKKELNKEVKNEHLQSFKLF
jgi:hypothetical protein